MNEANFVFLVIKLVDTEIELEFYNLHMTKSIRFKLSRVSLIKSSMFRHFGPFDNDSLLD